MFEVVIPGVRHGEAIMDTSDVYRGAHCYISGINADGYQQLNVTNTTALAQARITYPVNKYYFAEDHSDTSASVDKIAKGALCVYYEGGEYLTDQFNAESFGFDATYWAAAELTSATTWGRNPYVPGSNTAHSVSGLKKIWVCTGAVSGRKGVLYGDTSWSVGSGRLTSSANTVGFVTGVYYKDSANAYLRYRIQPGVNLTPVA